MRCLNSDCKNPKCSNHKEGGSVSSRSKLGIPSSILFPRSSDPPPSENQEVEVHRAAIVKYLRDVAKIYGNPYIKDCLRTCAHDIKNRHADTLPKEKKK